MNPKEEPTMSDEAQRVAIAEACPQLFRLFRFERGPAIQWAKEDACAPFIEVDLLNDLNAMAEVENVLTEEQKLSYGNALIEIADRDFGPTAHYSKAGTFHIIHATARQRVEAFLKVTGKWSPEKRSAQ